MKKNIIVLAIIVSCFSISGCVSNAEYHELEERVAYLESLHNIEGENDISTETITPNSSEDLNEYLKGATGIMLCYEYNTKENGWNGDYYQIVLREDKSSFAYVERESSEYGNCDFSRETFEDVLGLITNQKLEKYENEIDEKGMIVYKTLPRVLGVYVDGKEGYVLLKDPDNINEIVKKFEELENHAVDSLNNVENENYNDDLKSNEQSSDGSTSLIPGSDNDSEQTYTY